MLKPKFIVSGKVGLDLKKSRLKIDNYDVQIQRLLLAFMHSNNRTSSSAFVVIFFGFSIYNSFEF
jgi:hypothetical protein